MRFYLTFIIVAVSAALSGVALASDDETEDVEEDIGEGSVTGGKHGKVIYQTIEYEKTIFEQEEPITAAEAALLPYPNFIYRGARSLGIEPEFVNDTYEGIELIYKRDYKRAKSHWDSMNGKYPARGLGHVGNVLIYQSLMLENFDYRYESQYKYHSGEAIAELNTSLKEEGDEAWEHFLLGGMIGVESIHTMRKGDFVPALSRGLEAIGHIKEGRERAPDFSDPVLGEGLYKYWRSVVTMNSKVLPDFSDEREAGLSLMKKAEVEAIFVRPAASLAMAFSWIEERQMRRALDACSKNYRPYPANIINNMLMGRIFMYMRNYDKSIETFNEALATSPDNQRVHYYLATTLLRKRDYDAAEREIDIYLKFDLESQFKAAGLHRKADIYYRRKDYKTAEKYYKQAVKEDDYKPSKARIKRIKQLKKEGKI